MDKSGIAEKFLTIVDDGLRKRREVIEELVAVAERVLKTGACRCHTIRPDQPCLCDQARAAIANAKLSLSPETSET